MFTVTCNDGKERLGKIRGSMRNKVWINTNDIVLVSVRSFQDTKVDIIHKYSDGDVRQLNKTNELSFCSGGEYPRGVDKGDDDGASECVFNFEDI